METLIFILICYGACNNMIYGSIFQGWRDMLAKFGTGGYSIHKLFTCFMCLGTWMGFAVSFIMFLMGYTKLTPVGSLGVENVYLMVFLNGLLATAGVWLIHTLQEFLERGFTNNKE
jgi:hypothetical protein